MYMFLHTLFDYAHTFLCSPFCACRYTVLAFVLLRISLYLKFDCLFFHQEPIAPNTSRQTDGAHGVFTDLVPLDMTREPEPPKRDDRYVHMYVSTLFLLS